LLRLSAALKDLRLISRGSDTLAVSLDISRELATLRALLDCVPFILTLAPAPAAALRLTHAMLHAMRGILRGVGLAHLTTHRFGRRWRTLVNFHLGHILL
jgi:hypothetical protein